MGVPGTFPASGILGCFVDILGEYLCCWSRRDKYNKYLTKQQVVVRGTLNCKIKIQEKNYKYLRQVATFHSPLWQVRPGFLSYALTYEFYWFFHWTILLEQGDIQQIKVNAKCLSQIRYPTTGADPKEWKVGRHHILRQEFEGGSSPCSPLFPCLGCSMFHPSCRAASMPW